MIGAGVQVGEGLGVRVGSGVDVGVLVGVDVQVAVAVGVNVGVEVAVGVMVEGSRDVRNAPKLSVIMDAIKARQSKAMATKRPDRR